MDSDTMYQMWDEFLSSLDGIHIDEEFQLTPHEMGEIVAEMFFEWYDETRVRPSGRTAIGVDFDGVLHQYNTPMGLNEQDRVYDPPVEGALEWVEEVLEHFDIIVYTCRHVSSGGLDAVRYWLEEWGFPDLPVTGVKPVARVYVDDRGYHFNGKNFPSVAYLKNFVPWNRKETGKWGRE